MKQQHAAHYRPDIDGLRSLAIVPILLLHCGVTSLRGGFIGVDIFFVISGYLITGIIVRELDQETFSLTQFYRRRIVRILPALAVMAAFTLLAGCLILLPNPLRDLGQSAAAVSVFASNIYFFATGDYFAQASELKPLIHTWSLAVEEQFYLFYPLLLLALRRLDRRRLIVILCCIGLLSFAIGGWLAAYQATAGYFLLPARIWELVLGALISLGFFPRLAHGFIRSALCLLAIAGILVCAVVTGSGWPFPVPFALPPTAAAAFLLAYAPGTSAAKLLSARIPRAIGLISYSLYLWHRPIVALYLAGRSYTLGWQDSLLLLMLSGIAATASYWLVEQPAQKRWRSGTGLKPHLSAAIGIVVWAAAGLAIAANADRIRHLPPKVSFVASYLGFEASPAGRRQFGTDRCFVIPTGKNYDPSCMTAAIDRPNVLLVGDSHAAQLSDALRQAMPNAHILQATAAGCRPLLSGQGLRRCRAIVDAAFHTTDSTKIGTVILAGRWFDADAEPLAQTVRFLKGRGFKVLIVGPVVEYDADVPEILARAMLAGDPGRILALRTIERERLDHKLAPIVKASGARYVSYLPIECPANRCRLFTATGAPLHMDQSHVTPELAQQMAQSIALANQR
ncbi:acyltransferase family protein [Novosphingobium sp. Rr 2-17]|uniref:acyltransferase family protein n=1 Tax=Novosphingobium sp. Rr 2-17 TaxID=555793 RepID=UPI0012F6ABD8|nr:acyltransferase family protein [Novosphingobium sp. Rr 2-17]